MIEEIVNYHKYNEKLAAGGQPTAEQLEALKNEGYEVIVNISTPSARNFLHREHSEVENLGMYYVHFPVDCSALDPVHYSTFSGIMKGISGRKVFVHCGGNIKSSNLIHMYHVLEEGMDERISFETLLKIQEPEEKWNNYFKMMGMRGVYAEI